VVLWNYGAHKKVSILVLVEVVREVLNMLFWQLTLSSFNPCFGGSGSGSGFLLSNCTDVECGFNPCFGGSGSGSLLIIFHILFHMQFQSLFWWKWFGKGFSLLPAFAKCRVSILVLVEVVREVLLGIIAIL